MVLLKKTHIYVFAYLFDLFIIYLFIHKKEKGRRDRKEGGRKKERKKEIA